MGLGALLQKRGVLTGYSEAQSLKRTCGFRTRTGDTPVKLFLTFTCHSPNLPSHEPTETHP